MGGRGSSSRMTGGRGYDTRNPSFSHATDGMSDRDANNLLRAVELYTRKSEGNEYYDMTQSDLNNIRASARRGGLYDRYSDMDTRIDEAIAWGQVVGLDRIRGNMSRRGIR